MNQSMSKIIVLMGAPGAGKGTQARLLQERMSLPQISTGDIFRALSEAETPLAQEVRTIQQAGRLIPDEVVIRVVEQRTWQQDCRNGYILDGFPRTAAQAEMLEQLAGRQGHQIKAILIHVPIEFLMKRLTGRWTCPICGEIYNLYSKPPKLHSRCDLHPETELVHRADDAPEKIRVRLETYKNATTPLIDYYESTARLHRIDGTRSREEIYLNIERVMNEPK
jgi:adenylate kinase